MRLVLLLVLLAGCTSPSPSWETVLPSSAPSGLEFTDISVEPGRGTAAIFEMESNPGPGAPNPYIQYRYLWEGTEPLEGKYALLEVSSVSSDSVLMAAFRFASAEDATGAVEELTGLACTAQSIIVVRDEIAISYAGEGEVSMGWAERDAQKWYKAGGVDPCD